MLYLTEEEFGNLGFDEVYHFDSLVKRACLAIDLYTRQYYKVHSWADEHPLIKEMVKQAVAFQVAYLDSSGMLSADDKATAGHVSIGRTSVTYQKPSASSQVAGQYNLSLDALNWLKQAGFNYLGVDYDR